MLVFLINRSYAQSYDSSTYIYLSEKGLIFKKMDLFPDSTFNFISKVGSFGYTVTGIYCLTPNALYLNSCNKIQNFAVTELISADSFYRFKIVNNNGISVETYLHLILSSGDTISYPNSRYSGEYDLNIKEKIVAFWIGFPSGLSSKYYKIKNESCNLFKVLFEPVRIFDNEKWSVNSSGIYEYDPGLKKVFELVKKW